VKRSKKKKKEKKGGGEKAKVFAHLGECRRISADREMGELEGADAYTQKKSDQKGESNVLTSRGKETVSLSVSLTWAWRRCQDKIKKKLDMGKKDQCNRSL